VVSWAVVAINDCGRSEPSTPIHLVVLP
jgi:hypothetical protein